MSATFRQCSVWLVLGTAMSAATISAQVPPPQAQGLVDDINANAEETRDQLSRLLQQYPPNLMDVLRLDHSLLTNKEFLTPYPRLSAFVSQHPEVLRNPTYFVGQGNRRFEQQSPQGIARDVMDFTGPFLVMLTLLGAASWIIRSII